MHTCNHKGGGGGGGGGGEKERERDEVSVCNKTNKSD